MDVKSNDLAAQNGKRGKPSHNVLFVLDSAIKLVPTTYYIPLTFVNHCRLKRTSALISSNSDRLVTLQSMHEISPPVAQAVDKLQHSLTALRSAVDLRTTQLLSLPHGEYAAGVSLSVELDSGPRLSQKLSTLLGSLFDHFQNTQHTNSSRIDDEIDASYILEMN